MKTSEVCLGRENPAGLSSDFGALKKLLGGNIKLHVMAKQLLGGNNKLRVRAKELLGGNNKLHVRAKELLGGNRNVL